MRAKITEARKEILPRYDAEQQMDIPTLQIVVGVDFEKDDGTLFSHQQYSYLPADLANMKDNGEDVKGIFQKQADAMQADLDREEATKEQSEAEEQADELINDLLS